MKIRACKCFFYIAAFLLLAVAPLSFANVTKTLFKESFPFASYQEYLGLLLTISAIVAALIAYGSQKKQLSVMQHQTEIMSAINWGVEVVEYRQNAHTEKTDTYLAIRNHSTIPVKKAAVSAYEIFNGKAENLLSISVDWLFQFTEANKIIGTNEILIQIPRIEHDSNYTGGGISCSFVILIESENLETPIMRKYSASVVAKPGDHYGQLGHYLDTLTIVWIKEIVASAEEIAAISEQKKIARNGSESNNSGSLIGFFIGLFVDKKYWKY